MSLPLESAPSERPWLASYPPGVPGDYAIPTVAVPRLLDDAARDFPNHPAVVADGVTTDYATLRHRVDEVAGALSTAGVAAGDQVIVALPNGLALPVVLLALWRLGAVAVPLPAVPGGPAGSDVAERFASAAAVIATPALLGAAAQDQEPVTLLVGVDGTEWLTGRGRGRLAPIRGTWQALRQRATALPDGAVPLAALLDGASSLVGRPTPVPAAPALVRCRRTVDDDALDAIVLTQANLVAGAFQARLWIPDVQAGRERILVADPLCDPAVLTVGWLAALLSAAAVVLLDDPDPDTIARTVEREAPTVFTTTTSRLEALASGREVARRDLSSLRLCLASTSGRREVPRLVAPAALALLERRSAGGRVRVACALDEGGLTHAQPVYGRILPGTVGLPVTATAAAVVDPDDHRSVCAPGDPGQLAVAGPQMGGRQDDGATAVEGGWVVTDIRAVMSPDGVFTCLDEDGSTGPVKLAGSG